MFPGGDKSLQTTPHKRKVIFTRGAIAWVRFYFRAPSVPLGCWRSLCPVFSFLTLRSRFFLVLQRATCPLSPLPCHPFMPHIYCKAPGNNLRWPHTRSPGTLAPSPGIKPCLGRNGWLCSAVPQLRPLEVQRNQPTGRAFHPCVPFLDPLQLPREKPVLPEEAGGAGWALGRSGWHRARRRGEGPPWAARRVADTSPGPGCPDAAGMGNTVTVRGTGQGTRLAAPGHATAPGHGAWCKGRDVAGSASSSPCSAQSSPMPQFGGASACARGEQRGSGPARLSQPHVMGAALFSRLCNTHLIHARDPRDGASSAG